MKKVTNHKGWVTAIFSIIPFFIFTAIFQAIGLGISSALGNGDIINLGSTCRKIFQEIERQFKENVKKFKEI